MPSTLGAGLVLRVRRFGGVGTLAIHTPSFNRGASIGLANQLPTNLFPIRTKDPEDVQAKFFADRGPSSKLSAARQKNEIIFD